MKDFNKIIDWAEKEQKKVNEKLQDFQDMNYTFLENLFLAIKGEKGQTGGLFKEAISFDGISPKNRREQLKLIEEFLLLNFDLFDNGAEEIQAEAEEFKEQLINEIDELGLFS